MREIICVERNTVTENGRSVVSELRYTGTLTDDGQFQLRAVYGKRFPAVMDTGCTKSHRSEAA